ncbi:hypothetical protein J2Z53_000727 [Clostridium moniliforme]|uniref:Acetyltransferase n=1 Tax=Clostridium moniliforme TaxID=39489 RepID=A0ABS4EYS4_9CLOT|nr:hypothetical protein [Clostridium moniliforme]MBP1889146.1 hypothetical protein [Clostridium moniliforme]
MIKKIITKIRIILKISYYRINFKSKIKFGKKVAFRKNFNIIIEGHGSLEIGDNCFLIIAL